MLNLENMRPWEKINMVIRRHWIVYVFLFLYFLWALLLSVVLYSFFWFHPLNNMVNIILWMSFSLFLYVEWINHELDLYVVTNNRVIGIEQISFLDRTVSECSLWQIQEVNSQTKWLLANILNYWSLSVQTAWSTTTMKMIYAPDSMQKARILLNIVDDYRDNHWIWKKENNQ